MSNELLEDLIEEHKKSLNEKKNAKKQNLLGVKKRLVVVKEDLSISKKRRDAEIILLEKEITNLELAYKQATYSLNMWQEQYIKLRGYLKSDYKKLTFADSGDDDA